jgi:murein DD-endopeptidase MepM/ murein hydrolase activator NlpD
MLEPMRKRKALGPLNNRKLTPKTRVNPGAVLRPFLALCAIAVAALIIYAFVRDGGAPTFTLTPKSDTASFATSFSLKMTGGRSGLRDVVITASQDGKRVDVLRKDFADKPAEHTAAFKLPRDAGFKQGPIDLTVEVRNNALLSFLGRGKASAVEKLTLDLTPPRLSVNPGVHNINQGGGAVVAYAVSKDVARTGVMVGELFFPAFLQKDGRYFCFFAMPLDVPPASFKPKIIAQDKAGNEITQSVQVLAIAKSFKSDKLNIPDEFLNDKMSQYTDLYPNEKRPVDIYKRVNSELRKKNVDELLTIGKDTAPTQLWSGPFLRLPAAAGRAGFGDQRDYYYNGELIDHQTHMGVDLASIACAPVPAANTGRIVYAGFFGIYGNCVIIDHGLGVQSLYSHLSEIDVAKGAEVKKGQIIAKTGATGLAGGDHLHFGMIISGIQVSPVEWWDEHWINDNIVKHLAK